jgi:hypothetical protein
MSSCKAEYVGATSVAIRGVCLAWLLGGMRQEEAKPVELKVGNIRVRYHYVRQCVEEGSVLAEFVSTKDQLADIGMKELRLLRFQELCTRIGMVQINSKLKHKS